MLRWFANALASSVGKKIVLGLTGLLLVGFLIEHIHGNTMLYEGEGAFEEYVEWLQGFGPLLVVAELGLAALFLCHIFLALRVTMENRMARKQRYVVRNDRGAKTIGSSSMFLTGAILLAFLIKHLLDFRFSGTFFDDPSGSVERVLSQPSSVLIYVVASITVGVHLSHGFRSAFQSIGLSHPKLNAVLEAIRIPLAVLFAAAFASFPIYYGFIHQ